VAAEVGEGRGLAKGNTDDPTRPGRRAGQGVTNGLDRVREAARRNREAKFTALLHHVDLNRLWAAYVAINPKAASGVDKVTWEDYGQDLRVNLEDLLIRVHSGAYRASPSRRAYIPKTDGRLRPLGIATLEDKILQRAVVEVLNAIYEEDFLGFSYGFRPGRKPHDALDALAVGMKAKKVNYVLDADICDFFESSTHCSFRCWSWREQLVLGGWRLDTQAFPASGANMDSAQLSALYTLHDRLARHPGSKRRLKHGEPSRRRIVDEERADLSGEPDAPRRAGGDLFASDEPVAEPAMQRRWSEAEVLGGLLDREQLSFLGIRGGNVTRDAVVVAERLDAPGDEGQSGGGGSVLAVQDACDHVIGVVHRQAAHQRDGVFVGCGSAGGSPGLFIRPAQVADRASL